MTQDTQSTWYVERPFGEPGVYVTDRETSALIAKLYGPDAEANAQQVAALPLLLDALRIAETLIAADIVRDDAGCLSKVRAVIAKATGKQ